MTNKQWERRLAQALSELSPQTTFETVAQAAAAEPTAAPAAPVAVRRRPHRRLIAAAVAACLVALLAVGGGVYYQQYHRVDTVIDIDVNPGIELAVNRSDRVLTAEAVNPDGERVLKGLHLKNKPLSEAVDVLFDAMVAQGYVVGEDNCILVTVQTADGSAATRLRRTVSDCIETTLAQHDITAPVATQTVADFDAVVAFAKKNGISKGKAAFVLGLVEQEPTLEAENLAQYPFSSLAALAQHLNIPLEGLTDYDALDGLGKRLEEALTQEVTQAEEALGIPLLPPAKAKARALEALRDWEAQEALFVKAELTWDGETPVYQFELIVGSQVYEFAINALDGSYQLPESQQKPTDSTTSTTTTQGDHVVIRSTLPGGGTAAHFSDPPKTTTSPSVTETTAPTHNDGYIDGTEALEYAMADRGVTYDQLHRQDVRARRSGVKYGVPYYSVWLCVDDEYVYDYDIHGVTGEILSQTCRPLGPAESHDGEQIDRETAINLAIIHANARSEMPTILDLSMGRSPEGAAYHYIEFVSDGVWYAYEIHAGTGEVLYTDSTEWHPSDLG